MFPPSFILYFFLNTSTFIGKFLVVIFALVLEKSVFIIFELKGYSSKENTVDIDKIKKHLNAFEGIFLQSKTLSSRLVTENLELEKAESVQFLGDGAPWIWNRVLPMLLKLGVKKENVIETLDYYHAAEHINDMKVYFDKDKQGAHFDEVKEALWQGDFIKLTQLVEQGITGVDLAEFGPFKYFEKQQNRLDYQALRAQNRPCGSGIIESGIRRIINLRFKSPSTFWFPENVEKLILMRAAVLSGRWEIMMNDLFCKT